MWRLAVALAAAALTMAEPAIAAQPTAAAPARIVAVGDVHGDYDAWVEIASKARLIDARSRWAGG
jgi:hypothetical protein